MNEPDIITLLKAQNSKFTITDLDWIVPRLVDKYNDVIYKINLQTKKNDDLSLAAVTEIAKKELHSALDTFLFKKQYSPSTRNIESYLLKTLKNVKSTIYKNYTDDYRKNKLICPYCKSKNEKFILDKKGKLYSCLNCCNQLIKLEEEFELEKDEKKSFLIQEEIRARSIFANHSRQGVKCPTCSGWLPKSAFKTNLLHCVYNCSFIGSKEDYIDSSFYHPISSVKIQQTSLDAGNWHLNNNSIYEELGGLQENFNYSNGNKKIEFESQLKLIEETINQQQEALINVTTTATYHQKYVMYEAFKQYLYKNPQNLISYLIYKKSNSKYPIQSQIFQQYVDLMFNYLPFEMIRAGQKYIITDPCDANLGLFLGISTFEAEVKDSGIIPNLTNEHYIGGKKFTDYGPCFIGRIIDVTVDDKSVLEEIIAYSFIEVYTNLSPGTKVKVRHYRIASHYEIHSMVFLQQIRKSLVEKLNLKLKKDLINV